MLVGATALVGASVTVGFGVGTAVTVGIGVGAVVAVGTDVGSIDSDGSTFVCETSGESESIERVWLEISLFLSGCDVNGN